MDRLSELQVQIEERTARIIELRDLDTITPEQDAELDTLLDDQERDNAEVAKLEARAARVAAATEARQTTVTPGVAPTFIRKVDTYDYEIRNLRTESEIRDRTMRVLEDNSVTRYAPAAAVDAADRNPSRYADRHC